MAAFSAAIFFSAEYLVVSALGLEPRTHALKDWPRLVAHISVLKWDGAPHLP